MKKAFELLAPAGTMDALIAALHNGADAVYLGGKSFNARNSAGNFDLKEISEAVRHAHLHDAQVYVTVNTLLRDDELPLALEYVGDLYRAGVDALILQDIGLASLIRQAFPRLSLHASTQMTVHNSASAKMLEEMGFHRIIAERQLTLAELIRIREEITAELEVFAHGALCISYSGQCLMSSLIGGRSGNRGRCAQPCRLEYTLIGSKSGTIENKDGTYLLSTKDLNLSEVLPCLIENGFSGLKIEGRMKRPEYVATVVRIYRELIDRYFRNPEEYCVTVEELRQLEQIFNRDFTKGFLMDAKGRDLMSLKRPNNRGVHIGRVTSVDSNRDRVNIQLEKDIAQGDGIEVWVSVGGRVGTILDQIYVNNENRDAAYAGEIISIHIEGRIQPGDRVFRTHDSQLIAIAQNTFLNGEESGKIPLKVRVKLKRDEPMALEFTDPDGRIVTEVSKKHGEPARNYVADEKAIEAQLNRTGNTDFFISEYEWDVEPNTFMPVSIINDLRRNALDQLTAAVQKDQLPKDLDESIQKMNQLLQRLGHSHGKATVTKLPKLAITVNDYAEFQAACRAGADIIYWGGDYLKTGDNIPFKEMHAEIARSKIRRIELGFAFPRITKDSELDPIMHQLSISKNFFPHSVRVANLGQLRRMKELADTLLCIDYPQHTFNGQALDFYRCHGASRVTLSPELTLAQMKDLSRPEGLELECIIHGQLPVMITEYCPIGTVQSKGTEFNCAPHFCMQEDYAVQDKMEYRFPLVNNGKCRTFILNSKELCLYDNLAEFVDSVFSSLRIEASGRGPSYVGQITSIYRHWLDRFASNEMLDQRELTHAKRVIQELSQGGLTKGHYYRGVE